MGGSRRGNDRDEVWFDDWGRTGAKKGVSETTYIIIYGGSGLILSGKCDRIKR